MSTEFMFLSNTIGEIFSSTYLEKMARETGFIQREGKLKAKDFISLCTFLNDQSGEKSLNQLCSTLDSNRNVNLSSEGLNQRFNDSAVTFLKRIFTDTLSKKLLDHSGFTHKFRGYFNRIRILDSTGFGLPDSCSELYKGSTGAGAAAPATPTAPECSGTILPLASTTRTRAGKSASRHSANADVELTGRSPATPSSTRASAGLTGAGISTKPMSNCARVWPWSAASPPAGATSVATALPSARCAAAPGQAPGRRATGRFRAARRSSPDRAQRAAPACAAAARCSGDTAKVGAPARLPWRPGRGFR